MSQTKIEWAGASWNPISGCTKISAGCEHCYAERMANRLAGRYGYPADEPFRVTLHPDRLDEPLRRKKPTTYFVCSMGDLFHDDVPPEFIGKVFSNMPSRHKFLILTKRPWRMADYVSMFNNDNIWFGISVENQETYLRRIPALLRITSLNLFLSIEPLLGPIPNLNLAAGIKGVIVGGESGPGARPMHPDWVRSIRDQCAAAGVMFYMKQWGEWGLGSSADGAAISCVFNENSNHCIQPAYSHNVIKSSVWMRKIGKKAAGRLLDGVEYNDLPWM